MPCEFLYRFQLFFCQEVLRIEWGHDLYHSYYYWFVLSGGLFVPFIAPFLYYPTILSRRLRGVPARQGAAGVRARAVGGDSEAARVSFFSRSSHGFVTPDFS